MGGDPEAYSNLYDYGQNPVYVQVMNNDFF